MKGKITIDLSVSPLNTDESEVLTENHLRLRCLTIDFLCEFMVFITAFIKTHNLWQIKPETKMVRW